MSKFYWLKLDKNFFKRHDITIIETMPNGKDYVLFYLKLLCESLDHDGCLRFSEEIPYSEEMLSTITNTDIDVVRSAVKLFSQLKMMELLDDGTYFMNRVNAMIGSAVNNDNANRQRRYREQKKEQEKTLLLQNVTDSVTKNNESKSKSKSKSKNIYIVEQNDAKAKIVIDYLNQKTGKAYKYVESNLKFINARLKDGYTVEDCKSVIDKKCKEWLNDSKMKNYLRIETLFNATKFESYINQEEVSGGKEMPAYTSKEFDTTAASETDIEKVREKLGL